MLKTQFVLIHYNSVSVQNEKSRLQTSFSGSPEFEGRFADSFPESPQQDAVKKMRKNIPHWILFVMIRKINNNSNLKSWKRLWGFRIRWRAGKYLFCQQYSFLAFPVPRNIVMKGSLPLSRVPVISGPRSTGSNGWPGTAPKWPR